MKVDPEALGEKAAVTGGEFGGRGKSPAITYGSEETGDIGDSEPSLFSTVIPGIGGRVFIEKRCWAAGGVGNGLVTSGKAGLASGIGLCLGVMAEGRELPTTNDSLGVGFLRALGTEFGANVMAASMGS